jgi:FMN-dependent NADH-azoreductase
MNILHIDSSIHGEASASRRLSAAVVARLRQAYPRASLVYRDVVTNNVPQLGGGPAGAPDAADLTTVVDQVLAADVIVIGAPMYNFGIPSQLKSWLDALAVPGKTFRYGAEGAQGLLGEKRVVIASARGALYGADSPYAALDHQERYLQSFFGFLGVTRIDTVRAEGLKVSDDMNRLGIETALRQAAELETA